MTKWTTADIPDQTGRTAVITGANTGLGYETAAALAAKGAHVVLAVRNLDKGKDAADRITTAIPGASVAVQELDLTSLESIRSAADQLRPTYDAIDLLINNAGVMMTPKSTTKDGFELQFGTNHLGHFALTGLLLDRVLAAPGSRVVTVSSQGHRFAARHPLRRPPMGPRLQPGRRVRAGQAGQPDVHLRTAAPADGHEDHRRGRTSRRFQHRAGAQSAALRRGRRALVWRLCPGPEMGALPTLRAATDPACSAGSTSVPTDSANSGATRRSWRPARHRTTRPRNAGCGRSPRS